MPWTLQPGDKMRYSTVGTLSFTRNHQRLQVKPDDDKVYVGKRSPMEALGIAQAIAASHGLEVKVERLADELSDRVIGFEFIKPISKTRNGNS